mmetsp:Transcript_20427/g.28298  ORF Transcript_20427/g.28298 Transcript_20427/m.28298 type:complete len:117 (-) Transcript_20427:69-419(-)|eukprot:CAMPEP_0196572272 /NCGR_PEP_ID=MMETSP1081-20130531/2354_1 /TAXON_ID=36882 /ORGANISM="Pyramimonas amylifera, Strain CCMP720" /LENGTH=116 /DNA_ID=CAMNT_0041889535 /DNA_START=119 /DNA_END=469 /DNA_ORIENTATION=+
MSAQDTCLTFTLEGEDHTLANALRYVLNKNPYTELCGYSVPHPSEDLVNVRVQTNGDVPAAQVFREGVADLCAICDIISDNYDAELERFLEESKKRGGKEKHSSKNNSKNNMDVDP